MIYFLRKVRNKNRWGAVEEPDWLRPEEIQADLVTDLNTTDNTMSMWRLSEGRSNLSRIIAAVALSGADVRNIDYLIFNSALLDGLRIKYQSAGGDTCDRDLNSEWHYDAVHLSGESLLLLARAIRSSSEKARATPKEVLSVVAESVASGFIREERISEKFKERL